MLFEVLVVGAIFLVLYKWWDATKYPTKDFPPGPIGLPLVGYPGIYSAKTLLHAVEKLHTIYGDVISLNIGPHKRDVVIGSAAVAREVFKDERSTGRPAWRQWYNVAARYGNGSDARGLVFSQGHEWREQRKFAVRTLKSLGFGKSSMEEMIHTDIEALLTSLKAECENEVDVVGRLYLYTFNSLWRILTGSGMDYDDPQLKDFGHHVKFLGQAFTKKPVALFPFLRHVIPKQSGATDILASFAFYKEIIVKAIDNQLESKSLIGGPSNFIGCYLKKIEAENANVTCSFNGPRGLQSLESSILDLTLAGADTTTVTLEWAMLFACLHPAAQSRLQNEIESVVGWEELPALSHRQQMPFTEAFIQEVLRIGDPVPIGFPHSVTDDMWAGRWFLPAGTTVYLNQYHILRDPATFQAPNEFRPERFLDESGRFDREEARKVVVFSVGKRDCLGQSVALNQVFLFLTAILQHFRVAPADPKHPPSTESVPSLIRTPCPFKVRMYPRHKRKVDNRHHIRSM